MIAFAKEQEEQLVRDARAINETWLAYPDDDPVRTSSTAADSRAALAPLLAHQVGLQQLPAFSMCSHHGHTGNASA